MAALARPIVPPANATAADAAPWSEADAIDALAADPRTAGRMVDLHPTQPAAHTHRLFLGGTWSAGGLPVLVKLHASPWELQLAAIFLAWLGALWWGIAPWRRADAAWREQIRRYAETAAAC